MKWGHVKLSQAQDANSMPMPSCLRLTLPARTRALESGHYHKVLKELGQQFPLYFSFTIGKKKKHIGIKFTARILRTYLHTGIAAVPQAGEEYWGSAFIGFIMPCSLVFTRPDFYWNCQWWTALNKQSMCTMLCRHISKAATSTWQQANFWR